MKYFATAPFPSSQNQIISRHIPRPPPQIQQKMAGIKRLPSFIPFTYGKGFGFHFIATAKLDRNLVSNPIQVEINRFFHIQCFIDIEIHHIFLLHRNHTVANPLL